MTAKISSIDAEIKQRIIDEVGKLQGRVFDGDVPEGENIPVDASGRALPYATVVYGGVFRTGRRMRGIVSSRNNVKYHTVMILVTGSNVGQASIISDDVRDALEGHEPVGGSEMYEETSGTARLPSDSTMRPVRYTSMLVFSLLINP